MKRSRGDSQSQPQLHWQGVFRNQLEHLRTVYCRAKMGIREVKVDARSRGRGGTRAGRPTPALRYLAARVAFSVVIYFELTHDITMECTLVAYWYSVQDALHEVLGSNPNVMHIRTFVFPCMYQYVPSTYQVQLRYVLVHTCKCFGIQVQTSMYLVWQRVTLVCTMLY